MNKEVVEEFPHGCCSNTTVPCEDLECSNCRLPKCFKTANVKFVDVPFTDAAQILIPCEDLECSNCRLLNQYSFYDQ